MWFSGLCVNVSDASSDISEKLNRCFHVCPPLLLAFCNLSICSPFSLLCLVLPLSLSNYPACKMQADFQTTLDDARLHHDKIFICSVSRIVTIKFGS